MSMPICWSMSWMVSSVPRISTLQSLGTSMAASLGLSWRTSRVVL